MYFFIGLLLTVFSIIELGSKRKYQRQVLNVLVVFLSFSLSLRYGQGSDYYGYYLQYFRVNASSSLSINSLYHGELGWYTLLVLSKRIGISFEIFIGILSIVMMFSIWRAIKKYSPYGVTSLLLLYPTYYLTYFFSSMRQGLVMSLFLGFGLNFLLKKKYLRYYCLAFILTLFHRSAAILLLLPTILYFKKRKSGKGIIVAIVAGVIFVYIGILNKALLLFGVLGYFKVSISIMAIILRAILFYIIFRLHKKNAISREKTGQKDEVENTLYYLYLIGFVIYLTLAFVGTLSQRLTMPLKAIEVVLLPLLISNFDRVNIIQGISLKFLKLGSIRIVALAVLAILMINVEIMKNINSYISQGNYHSWVNAINYPYSTVFNKEYIRSYITHFDDEVVE